MNSVLDILFLRRPRIEYSSPPVCEAQFSSSGTPIVMISPFEKMLGPTGGRAGGRGSFFLSWATYPGQICYSIYFQVDPGNPNSPYNLISDCIAANSISLCSPGWYQISAISGSGQESPLSSPIQITGRSTVALPMYPHTAAYNLYKSTVSVDGPYELYWYGFTGNSFEVCVPGCYSISGITPDGESPLSSPVCTDGTCGGPVNCPQGTGWNPLLCECVPCSLIENPCPHGYIWDSAQCQCVAGGGGAGDLTDLMGPTDTAGVGTAYTSDILAVGGIAPYSWELVSGSLPDGLMLDDTSETGDLPITGTPTTAQASTFTIRCEDSIGEFISKEFTITVSACVAWPNLTWENISGEVPGMSWLAAGSSAYIDGTATGSSQPGIELFGTVTYNGPACVTSLSVAVSVTSNDDSQAFAYCNVEVADSLSLMDPAFNKNIGIWPFGGMDFGPGTYTFPINLPDTGGEDDTIEVVLILQLDALNPGYTVSAVSNLVLG